MPIPNFDTGDAPLKTYTCHCHCDAVRFTIKLPDLSTYEALKCNCSACRWNGYVLGYPKWDNVHFDKGLDNLQEYRFASKTRPHMFCKTCGTGCFIDIRGDFKEGATKYMALNLRTVGGIDVDKMKVMLVNGWDDAGPNYEAPSDEQPANQELRAKHQSPGK